MEAMYSDFLVQAAQMPSHQLCEVRYEDLVRAPIVEMGRIYRELKLDAFESVRPKLEAHLQELKSYRTNDYEVPEVERAEFFRRSRWYTDRYGYDGAPLPKSPI